MSKNHKAIRTSPSAFEPLEARRLFSVSYNADAQRLEVTGTSASDVIDVSMRDGMIRIVENGAESTHDSLGVTAVYFEGGDGDDSVRFHRFSLRAIVFGQAGNDTIIGSSGRDIFDGGLGDDFLRGGGGDDDLLDEAGTNVLRGDSGNDNLRGGSGNDTLKGDAGDDTLFDSAGANKICGGNGADHATTRPPDHNVTSVESQSMLPTEPTVDPMVELNVLKSDDGRIRVLARATHNAGGYANEFGTRERDARTFGAQIVGIDLAGPSGIRTQAIIHETHSYDLGKLKPGTYQFVAKSGQRTLATLRIDVTKHGIASRTPVVMSADP